MSTTSYPSTTIAPITFTPSSNWNTLDYGDPAVNTNITTCTQTTAPPSSFTTDGAQQCMTAMGMDTTCSSASASISGKVSAGLFGSVSAGAAASGQTGCENEALIYNQYQSDTNICNCLSNNTSITSTTTSSSANSFTSEQCVFCEGNNSNGMSCTAGGTCPPSVPCAINQSNASKVTIENNLSTQYTLALTNMISDSLNQVASSTQSSTTGTGNVAQGGKSSSVSSISAIDNQTNTQINDALYNLMDNFTSNNEILLQCGSPQVIIPATDTSPTVIVPAVSQCFGCVPIDQMNSSSILVNNIINTGFTTGITNSSLSSITQSGTSSQTNDNKQSTGQSSGNGYIIWIILGVVIIAGIIAGVVKARQAGAAATATATAATTSATTSATKSIKLQNPKAQAAAKPQSGLQMTTLPPPPPSS